MAGLWSCDLPRADHGIPAMQYGLSVPARSKEQRHGLCVVLRPPGAPAKYHANSANTRRPPGARPSSARPDLARLSRHIQECAKRSRPSSPKCALPPEALPRHHPGLLASTRSNRAEIPFLWRPSPPPRWLRPQPDVTTRGPIKPELNSLRSRLAATHHTTGGTD